MSDSRAPAVIIHRDDADMRESLGDECGFLEGLVSVDDEPLRLEGFQAQFMRSLARYRWVTKARQIGFSFIIALEALARCHLRKNYTAHIVSFSQAEAKEKILAARQAYESLPLGFRKKLVHDNKLELAFESPGGGDLSRIMAHPSKEPRGFKGDIYLDELAHYANDRNIYLNSRPLITRTRGQLTGCSTPMGCRGIFWEVATHPRRFPHHDRMVVPWHLSRFLCADIAAAVTAANAGLSTIELVERFGTDPLRDQFEGMPIEDFEQEFCAEFQDDEVAFLPYDLILSCAREEVPLVEDLTDLRQITGRLVAGYDVGRRDDRSVLTVCEEIDGVYTARLIKRYKKLPFHTQEEELRRVLNKLPITRLSIDCTGMGAQLAENLEFDYPGIVIGEPFTNESKERWATTIKILLQQERLLLPRVRWLVNEFHSIKRKVTPSGKYSFDAERTEDGHADTFWSIALAAQRVPQHGSHGAVVRVRIIGGDGINYDSNDENPRPSVRRPNDGTASTHEVGDAPAPTAIRPSTPEPGSYEWNRRMFVDGVYDDDNPPPPPPTFRPRTVDEAPFLVGRGD